MLFCCPLAVGSDLSRREIWDLNRNYYFEGHKSWESKVSGLVQSYRRSLEVWSKERRCRNLSGSRIYGRSGAGGDYQRNEWRRHIIRWDAIEKTLRFLDNREGPWWHEPISSVLWENLTHDSQIWFTGHISSSRRTNILWHDECQRGNDLSLLVSAFCVIRSVCPSPRRDVFLCFLLEDLWFSCLHVALWFTS